MHTCVTPPPVPYPPRYIIDPAAFFVALVGAPLLFTAVTFWILFIPVFALLVGGPIYLLLGTPLLMWHLRHNDGLPEDLSWLAFKTAAFGWLGTWVFAIAGGNEELFGLTTSIFGFGMIFGPAWAHVFGRIYTRLRRDFYAKPYRF